MQPSATERIPRVIRISLASGVAEGGKNASASQDIPVSPLFTATGCRHHWVKSLDGSLSDDADDGAAGGLVADRSAIDLAGGDEAVRDALAALASLGRHHQRSRGCCETSLPVSPWPP